MKFIEIKTTFEDSKEAQNLGSYLLSEKLIACAKIFEVDSNYVWKNEVCMTHEFVLLCVSKKSLYNQIEKAIKEKHSYEVPEMVATEICKISKEYADWIVENTL